MDKIQMAVIDDHDLFREGIKLVLGQIDGLEVVYDTSNGQDFVEVLDMVPVDIALMDIEMPSLNGVQTTIRALQAKPDLKIIVLTMFPDTGHYSQMIHAGTKGFILKKSNKHELQEAITTVYAGGRYFSQDILKKLSWQNSSQAAVIDSLTSREVEIMLLICKGFTSREISDKLFISSKTVETHRSNIFQKSGVRNSAGLIIWAIKNQYFTNE
jgi:DNA-binding NarL/FixJ family response regulator